MDELVESQRVLYNDALWERLECYKRTGRAISYLGQCRTLTECRRDIPAMAAIPLQLQRGTLKRLDGRRIRSKAFVSIRVHLHRKMEGKIKSCRIVRDGKQWYVCLVCKVEVAKKKIINSMVGLDVGLENLASLSTGEHKVGDCLKSAPGNVILVSK